MLDTSVRTNVTNNLSFNSVAGTLVKSCAESKFIRFHMDSPMAKLVFDKDKPRITDYTEGGRSYGKEYKQLIQVLQVMLCGGDNFLVEFVEVIDE